MAGNKYRQWTCTARREGRECGGYLGDIWDEQLYINGRRVEYIGQRCPACDRLCRWGARNDKQRRQVDIGMRPGV